MLSSYPVSKYLLFFWSKSSVGFHPPGRGLTSSSRMPCTEAASKCDEAASEISTWCIRVVSSGMMAVETLSDSQILFCKEMGLVPSTEEKKRERKEMVDVVSLSMLTVSIDKCGGEADLGNCDCKLNGIDQEAPLTLYHQLRAHMTDPS